MRSGHWKRHAREEMELLLLFDTNAPPQQRVEKCALFLLHAASSLSCTRHLDEVEALVRQVVRVEKDCGERDAKHSRRHVLPAVLLGDPRRGHDLEEGHRAADRLSRTSRKKPRTNDGGRAQRILFKGRDFG